MTGAEPLMLLFALQGARLATPALPGLRCRPLEALLPADEALLPLRGLLPPAVPLVDLNQILTGQPGEGQAALELSLPRGPLAYLVEATLDAVPLGGARLLPLPPLLAPLVPHAPCWRVWPREGAPQLVLDLAGLLDAGTLAALRAQAAELCTARVAR